MAIKRRLVLVEWLDSCTGDGWIPLDELKPVVMNCKSVGWLISKDSESLTIAGHLGEGPDQCCGRMTIPRKAIIRVRSIKMPD